MTKLMPRIAALAVALSALAACSSPNSTVRGKVIEGSVSLIGAVQGNDPRLTGPGIEGALITGRLDQVRRGGGLAFTGMSGKDGVINIKASDLRVFSEEITVIATRDRYAPARQVLVIPSQGRQMLIVLQPTGAAPPP